MVTIINSSLLGTWLLPSLHQREIHSTPLKICLSKFCAFSKAHLKYHLLPEVARDSQKWK